MEIEHTFDDIGVGSIKGGWSFGSVSGKCTIAFDEIGDWWITEIEVRISKIVNGSWANHLYLLDKGSHAELAHFRLLCRAIEEFDNDAIADEVADAMPLTYEPRSLVNAGRTL